MWIQFLFGRFIFITIIKYCLITIGYHSVFSHSVSLSMYCLICRYRNRSLEGNAKLVTEKGIPPSLVLTVAYTNRVCLIHIFFVFKFIPKLLIQVRLTNYCLLLNYFLFVHYLSPCYYKSIELQQLVELLSNNISG